MSSYHRVTAVLYFGIESLRHEISKHKLNNHSTVQYYNAFKIYILYNIQHYPTYDIIPHYNIKHILYPICHLVIIGRTQQPHSDPN